MVMTAEKVLGRTIRLLGVSNPINLATTGTNFPIFQVGDVRNRAPESRTFVCFIGFSYNGSGTVTWRIGDAANLASTGDWATVISGAGTAESMVTAPLTADTYANGVLFACRITSGATGTGILRAYGWTE